MTDKEKIWSIVSDICGEHWQDSSKQEKEGALGVAMMLAFMAGIPPTLDDLSEFLNISHKNLVNPYERLLTSGMFSVNFDAKSDKELLGEGHTKTAFYDKKFWNTKKAFRSAWCNIAGVASGLIDRNIDKRKI